MKPRTALITTAANIAVTIAGCHGVRTDQSIYEPPRVADHTFADQSMYEPPRTISFAEPTTVPVVIREEAGPATLPVVIREPATLPVVIREEPVPIPTDYEARYHDMMGTALQVFYNKDVRWTEEKVRHVRMESRLRIENAEIADTAFTMKVAASICLTLFCLSLRKL